MFDQIRMAAKAAIAAHDELLSAWREFQPECDQLDKEDLDLLRSLVKYRIYPIRAIEGLASQNLEYAWSAMLMRYLGANVDPDRGFGGFTFDIGGMATELLKFGGEASLRRMILSSEMNPSTREDRRFEAAVCEAVGIEEGDYSEWLNRSVPN